MTFQWKKYLLICFRCVLSVILFLFLLAVGSGNPTLSHMEVDLLYFFGGIVSLRASDAVQNVLWQAVPVLFLVYVYSNTFQKDFETSYIYVITRNQNKNRWFRKKTAGLFFETALAWAILFAVVLLSGVFTGKNMDGNAAFYITLYLCNFLSAFLLSFQQNCLSLYLGRAQSYLILALFYLCSLTFGVLTYADLAANPLFFTVLWPVNGMYLWHDGLPLVSEAGKEILQPVSGFTLWKSVLAEVAWFMLFDLFTRFRFNHSDLAGIVKE